jgi:hypothetical protein
MRRANNRGGIKFVAAVFAGAVALAGCTDYLEVDAAGHTTALPPKSRPSVPTPATAEVIPKAPEGGPDTVMVTAKMDQCGAAALQYLVGRPRTEIPVSVDLSNRRVYCETCVVTDDYRPERQDIVFDGVTGRVTSVKCG